MARGRDLHATEVMAPDWRLPYFRRLWAYGSGVLVVLGLLAVRDGQVWLASGMASLLAFGLLNLGWSVASGRVTGPARGSLVALLVHCSVLGLLQTPPNPMTPVFLILVPLLSSYMMSWEETRWWLVATVLCGGASQYAMAQGYHLHGAPRSSPGLVAALNFVGVVTAVMFFARWFQLQRDTLTRELEKALEARTALLASVSHEIRTPMNGVLGLTELMLGANPTPAQKEQLELIRHSGQGLVTLIDDLLDLARLERVGLELRLEPTRVDLLALEVGRLFTPLAQQKGLALRVEAPRLPTVLADGIRLRQVLTNLVNNAVKFTDAGTVHLRVRQEPQGLRFEVEDTGPGVPPDVLPRLFNPFERGASSTERIRGTGLGLALAKDLVGRMGGELGVQTSPGQGSCFFFTLSLPPAAEQPEAPPAAQRVPVPPSALPVLVVDDNAINLRVACGLVERAGYPVRQASNGLEAVEAAAQEPLGLVLMDCEMPGMDGLEATRRIRGELGEKAPTIVALTASGQPDDVRACLEAGMSQVLVKPLAYPQLVEVLDRLVIR